MNAPVTDHRNRSWGRRNFYILLGILLAAVFWLSESLVHCFILHHNEDITACLFPKDTNEVWMRSFICGLFIVFGIITQKMESRRVQAETRRGEEQFKYLVDVSPEAIAVYQDGQWIYANKAAIKLLGAEGSEAIIGKPMLAFVEPDRHEAVELWVRDLAEGKEADSELEERLSRLDGTSFLGEIHTVPVEFDGKPAIMVFARDIEEEKRAEEALVSSRDLLQSIIDNAPIRVFWKDIDSRFLGCNALFAQDAGLAGSEQVVGKSDADMIWRDQAELYRADDQQVIDSDMPKLGYEEPQTTPDGRTIWLRTSKVPLHDAEGKVIGMLGIYDDITERKQAETDLIYANRALRTISACNSVLVDTEDEFELLEEMCEVIVGHGGYMMAWVGIPDHDAGKRVRPVAQAGFEEGYLESIRINWDDTIYGQGPTGTAVRTRQTIVNQDYLNNPRMTPWKKSAMERGFRSSISLPLVFDDKLIAALTIYAAEANAFNPGEVELLQELAGDLAYGIGSLRLREEHAATEAKLDFMAHHDALTGLPNRTLLQDRFELARTIAKRHGTMIALLMLDIDRFQQVNDSLGHGVGDHLLVMVVERLQSCIRESDTISRVGGDEFAVLLGDIKGLPDIEVTVEKIIAVFTRSIDLENSDLIVTASIGISIYPDDATDFDRLFSQADTALFQAKADGGNGYHFFTEAMNADALEHMRLHVQMRQAIEDHEFQVYYQPQIDVQSGRVIGAEALLRWPQESGMISPMKFIPLAEQSGLIVPLGEWVLGEACRQAQVWRDDFQMPALVIAVNLSAVQFKRGDIVETVRRALEESGLPPERLELELTESVLLHDLDLVADTLHRLKKLDVKLSIDDFGTGYSSLTYLKHLAVDKLKIDQSFVRDMVADSEDAAIAKAVVELGRILKLAVIAEGVETEEQLQLLKEFGCNEVQGYLFGRPVPAEEFTRLHGCGLHREGRKDA